MPTSTAVLSVARSQLGVHEEPPGSNLVTYASWAGIPGQPWCAAFACWVLDQAGALDVPRFVYCPSGARAYTDRGRWSTTPTVGAVVFFEWPGAGRVCHVGLVELVRPDGSLVTIEGNTDEAGGGSGGKVMRHVRRANIAGYGHPVYAAPVAPSPGPGARRPTLRRGAGGEAVKALQAALNARGAHLTVDGLFGPATDNAVRHFQAARHLAVDGICGPKTWAALAG